MNGTVVYCRTANGSLDALDSQLASMLQYGKDIGFTPQAAYCDCNVSGATLERSALQALLSAVRAGEVRRILVKDLSRLTRNLFHIYELIGLFHKYDVELVSLNDGGVMDMTFAKEVSDLLMALAVKQCRGRKAG
jgi:DNA invertase Pin-like site-specific DNA recombinase